MIDVKQLLFEICGDGRVFDDGVDLLDEEILDSLAMIDLFTELEETYGVVIHPTRVDRELLRTPDGIAALIADAQKDGR